MRSPEPPVVPRAPHVPYTGGEKESLHTSLDLHRDAVLWKLAGLDDEQVRRPMTPTGTNLLGLVKHLAAVEYGWFCSTFGRETEPFWFDPATEDMAAGPDETTADILAFYARARAAADASIRETDLETTGTAWDGRVVSMRWVLIHMLEDTVRHAGHMDIVRELIDGAVGRYPGVE
ncbi:DinB family protein [Streptomyces cyaneofuscatus]|uniref:DinB family protein n=1 Tax=Streptomyces TaxID=1883 RepID=UPI00344CFE62